VTDMSEWNPANSNGKNIIISW